jgi:phosphoribosyl-ATP pyrophosphohydrolase/phosphoribosyl-AMP cyclohydrolase
MNIDFQKYPDRLVPAIIQDARTDKVLMLGFMNKESLELTQTTGKVTFYSRSRQTLWIKGETSGNELRVERILIDCDNDTVLIKATPAGPACHTGSDTCFGETNEQSDFLFEIEEIIRHRKSNPVEGSYTSELFDSGLDRIAQKVGEEAIELIIEAKGADKERFTAEAGDLIYHFLVLLAQKNVALDDVFRELRRRRTNTLPDERQRSAFTD